MFEISDITNAHLRQFPDEVLQPYVDEANAHYKDIVDQHGILESEIKDPYPIVVTRYLNAYTTFRFAEDSIGANNVEVSDNDMYVRMRAQFYDVADEYFRKIVPEVITGIHTDPLFGDDKYRRAASTGKFYRSL